MKKSIGFMLIALMFALAMAGCGSPAATATITPVPAIPVPPTDAVTETTQEPVAAAKGNPIAAMTREDGSGTRGAFVELFDVRDADKKDILTDDAEITNSTAVMMTNVAGNADAVGYISLGSLNDTVKALKIDGVEATAENIVNDTYKISRPFNIVIKSGGVGAEAQDFIDYIMSAQGQAVIEGDGYIKLPGAAPEFAGGKVKGTITISGSSSVGNKLMPALIDAYNEINPDLKIDLQVTDSGTGISDAIAGACDIGMSSRELKDTETGVDAIKICTDGVAVIVNNNNPIDGLTKDQVRSIYLGETINWSELG